MASGDLMVVGPSGTPGKVIAELQEIFAIKGGGEPTFHLRCDYKRENLNLGDSTGKQIERLWNSTGKQIERLWKINHLQDDPITRVATSAKRGEAPDAKRVYWFIGTKIYVQEVLIKCARIMQLEPITRGG